MTSPGADWEWSPIDGWRLKPRLSSFDPSAFRADTLTVTIETSDDGVDWTSPPVSTAEGEPNG